MKHDFFPGEIIYWGIRRAPESREHTRMSATSKGNTIPTIVEPSARPANLENGDSESQRFFSGQISQSTQRLLAEIVRVAQRPFNILITGETGTGKTYAAREIHRLSARSVKPFLELNCANLPEHLVEAELFGYSKGAFYRSRSSSQGSFEEADGGMLFLDEIGDISPGMISPKP